MSASSHNRTVARVSAWALVLAVALTSALSGVAAARPSVDAPLMRHAQAKKKHAKKKTRRRSKKRAHAAATTIDLCAKQRSDYPLPGGGTVAIWGFATQPVGTPCTDSAVVAALPAPVLDVNEGDNITINVTNTLPNDLSLDIPGITLNAGSTTVPAGGSGSISFTASSPGTYMYESSGDAGRQAELGLAGALIVRPATAGQAYDAARSAYDSEAMMVLGGIDPDLNAAAASPGGPGSFDMYTYDADYSPGGASTLRPTYRLVNGKAHPDIPAITAAAGSKVLLRYVNVGSEHAVMTMLGVDGTIVGAEASLLAAPLGVVAVTIPAGSTMDMIVTVPASATSGDRFAIYDRHLALVNGSSANAPGGRIRFIEVP